MNVGNSICNAKLSHQDIIVKIHILLHKIKQSRKVKIEWIPAHCDIWEHDIADELAVEAAETGITNLKKQKLNRAHKKKVT